MGFTGGTGGLCAVQDIQNWTFKSDQVYIYKSTSKFQSIENFGARMEEMIAGLKAVPLAQGYDEVFYPGEIEARNDADHRRAGLQLPDDTLDDLRTLAGEIGLADRLPFS